VFTGGDAVIELGLAALAVAGVLIEAALKVSIDPGLASDRA